MPESGRGVLQTLADLGQLSRGDVDPFLLDLCTLLLTLGGVVLSVRSLREGADSLSHLLDRPRKRR